MPYRVIYFNFIDVLKLLSYFEAFQLPFVNTSTFSYMYMLKYESPTSSWFKSSSVQGGHNLLW